MAIYVVRYINRMRAKGTRQIAYGRRAQGVAFGLCAPCRRLRWIRRGFYEAVTADKVSLRPPQTALYRYCTQVAVRHYLSSCPTLSYFLPLDSLATSPRSICNRLRSLFFSFLPNSYRKSYPVSCGVIERVAGIFERSSSKPPTSYT